MRKQTNRGAGDRSELFARYVLAAFGHTVEVERQDDYFGVDLYLKFVTLTPETMALNGLECAIQVKSNDDDISVHDFSRRTALYDLQHPLFLCVVNRSDAMLRIYSMLNRFATYWSHPEQDTVIDLKSSGRDLPPEQRFVNIHVGDQPILQFDAGEVDQEGHIAKRNEIISRWAEWIRLENDAISWKRRNIPLVPYVDVVTNQSPLRPVNLLDFSSEKTIRPTAISALTTLDQLRVSMDHLRPDDLAAKEISRDALKLRERLLAYCQGNLSRPHFYEEYYLSDPALSYFEESHIFESFSSNPTAFMQLGTGAAIWGPDEISRGGIVFRHRGTQFGSASDIRFVEPGARLVVGNLTCRLWRDLADTGSPAVVMVKELVGVARRYFHASDIEVRIAEFPVAKDFDAWVQQVLNVVASNEFQVRLESIQTIENLDSTEITPRPQDHF